MAWPNSPSRLWRVNASDWDGKRGEIGRLVEEESRRTLRAYKAQPSLIAEQANQEQDTARGGYAHRQLVELIQNSADQLSHGSGGRIEVRLSRTHLYCADNGRPLEAEGARALLFSHLSPKRDTAEIGRFGVGFKSVLGVSDCPQVYSRSGSIGFDREQAAARIRGVAPEAEQFPVLRVAEPINVRDAAKRDPVLRELCGWATNVVCLPLKAGGYEDLSLQLRQFRAEFLLFVPHVSQLDLMADESDDAAAARRLRLAEAGGELALKDGGTVSRWMVFEGIHELSAAARADSRALDNAESVQLKWAAPLDRMHDHQHFWAFFPTLTPSLVGGILNAPWKTNEDRQNLLPGDYNSELIEAAAELVAECLPRLSNRDHPARHLDVLPRREEAGDAAHSQHMRSALYARLAHRAIAPDREGRLRPFGEIRVAPSEVTPGQRVEAKVLERWERYRGAPTDWLHADALISDRLAALGRAYMGGREQRGTVPRAEVGEWLQALIGRGGDAEAAVEASRAAVETAALLYEPHRYREMPRWGRIVYTAAGGWAELAPGKVYLSGGLGGDQAVTVHPQLQSDRETLAALQRLEIEAPSAESGFRELVQGLLQTARDPGRDRRWKSFWEASRQLDAGQAAAVVDEVLESRDMVRLWTMGESWEPIREVLLPGAIVTQEENDAPYVVADMRFHAADRALLRALGAVESPRGGYRPTEEYLRQFTDAHRELFVNAIDKSPRRDLLVFDRDTTSGPLEVFQYLAPEMKARFTAALLEIDDTYAPWTMFHETQTHYGQRRFESPAVAALREYGCVDVGGEVVALRDGLGAEPLNREVQHHLLAHPKSHLIRDAFPDLNAGLDDAEPVGDDEPIPLLEVWPGLRTWLGDRDGAELIRCDRIVDGMGQVLPFTCEAAEDGSVLLVRQADEAAELREVVRALRLGLSDEELEAILARETPADIAAQRERIRDLGSDAARLLAAVGEAALRRRLPPGLVSMLEEGAAPFRGERVAEAAIAQFHTGALREYKRDLAHLDPPKVWAGRPRAVEFVRSLGLARSGRGGRGGSESRSSMWRVRCPCRRCTDINGRRSRMCGQCWATVGRR